MKRAAVGVTAAEAGALLAAIRGGGFAASRAKIILTVASGVSLAQTALDLGVHRDSVQRAVKAWKAGRLRALEDPRVPRTLDLKRMVALLRSPPPEGTEWTHKQLAAALGCSVAAIGYVLRQRQIAWK